MQKSIFFAKNSKKFVYYNEELVTNSKFQTQFSRKLQRFRTCRKNKKCSIFHDLFEYIIFSYGCKLLDWSFKSDFVRKWNYGSIVRRHFLKGLGFCSKQLFLFVLDQLITFMAILVYVSRVLAELQPHKVDDILKVTNSRFRVCVTKTCISLEG